MWLLLLLFSPTNADWAVPLDQHLYFGKCLRIKGREVKHGTTTLAIMFYNKRQIFRMMRKRANLENCGEREDTVQNASVRASSARTSTAEYAAKLLHCEIISHLTCIASLSVLSWHTNYQMRCWNIEAVEPRQIKIMNTFQNLIHGISNDPLPLHHGNYDRIDECVSFK